MPGLQSSEFAGDPILVQGYGHWCIAVEFSICEHTKGHSPWNSTHSNPPDPRGMGIQQPRPYSPSKPCKGG
jgi:hypothetical protein